MIVRQLFSVLCIHRLFEPLYAAKLRTWIGPKTLVDGVAPVARQNPGMAISADQKIYIFGGCNFQTSEFQSTQSCGPENLQMRTVQENLVKHIEVAFFSNEKGKIVFVSILRMT